MSKNSISQFSTIVANNTDIGGINVNTGWPPSNVGPAFRTIMAYLADNNFGQAVWNTVAIQNSSGTTGTWYLAPDPSSPNANLVIEFANEGGTIVSDGLLAVDANMTVSGTLQAAALGSGTAIVLPNDVPLAGKDTAGTPRSMLYVNGSNSTILQAAAGNVAVLANDGSTILLNIDGPSKITEGLGGYLISNNTWYYGRDTSGNAQQLLSLGGDNNTYLRVGPAGFLTIGTPASGYLTVGSSGVYAAGLLQAPTINATSQLLAPTRPVGESSVNVATTQFVNPSYALGNPTYRLGSDGSIEQYGIIGANVNVPGSFSFPHPFNDLDTCQVTPVIVGACSYIMRMGPVGTAGFSWAWDTWGGGLQNGAAINLHWFAKGH